MNDIQHMVVIALTVGGIPSIVSVYICEAMYREGTVNNCCITYLRGVKTDLDIIT